MSTRSFFAFLAIAVVAFLVVVDCTPAERAELAPLVVPLERDTCVGLRAAANATVDDVCATADELAPFVHDILISQSDAGAPHPRMLMFSLPAPKRHAPRRHCAQWAVDAGAPASEAGPP